MTLAPRTTLALLVGLMLGAAGCPSTPPDDDAGPPSDARQSGVDVEAPDDVERDAGPTLPGGDASSPEYSCAPLEPPSCEGGKTLTGLLVIERATDLDDLAGVTCIHGDLEFVDTDLAWIRGVPDLLRVEGALRIVRNDQLIMLDPFPRL